VSGTPPGDYSQSDNLSEPTIQMWNKNSPPSLPPHLQRALLNTKPTSGFEKDPTVLPLPHHVMLNHLYSVRREDKGHMTLGVTIRYLRKQDDIPRFITTVLYKPLE
jgi:5'-AMP-activated protein kinase regulatory beta subunit